LEAAGVSAEQERLHPDEPPGRVETAAGRMISDDEE
jgi:hypothetical protein